MIDKLEIEQIASRTFGIEYDWWQIACDKTPIGCIRGLKDDLRLIISSIIIYPEYKGRGYDVGTVLSLQKTFKTIVTDTLFRKSTFWKQMGFYQSKSGWYEWNAK